MFHNLMNDAVNEIKFTLKPTFRRPYLSVKLQNWVSTIGLYDTGADISCINAEVFEKIPVEKRPPALEISNAMKFKSAGGQDLRVQGRFHVQALIEGRNVLHDFYVIKDLNEPVIFGIDFIEANELNFCPKTRSFRWKGQSEWQQGHLKVSAVCRLAPLSARLIQAKVRTEGGSAPGHSDQCLVTVGHPEKPWIMGGPYLVTPNESGYVTVPVYNCSPVESELVRNDFIGSVENVSRCDLKEINPKYLSAMTVKRKDTEPISAEKKSFILNNLNLNVPSEHKDSYVKVVLKNHECISQHRFDLGRTDTLLHEITLKTDEPVYVKQFRIPDAHREEVERHVNEWLKMGVVQSTRSKYNSPIFAVAKKNGGIRLVQDFRALNAQTHVDKYSMKDVSECIGDIGRSGSHIFSTIDLTGGFW